MSSLLPLLNDYYEYYRLLNEEDCYYCYEWSGLGFLLARGLPLKIFGDLELEIALFFFSSHRGAAIFAVLLRNHRIY